MSNRLDPVVEMERITYPLRARAFFLLENAHRDRLEFRHQQLTGWYLDGYISGQEMIRWALRMWSAACPGRVSLEKPSYAPNHLRDIGYMFAPSSLDLETYEGLKRNDLRALTFSIPAPAFARLVP